MATKKTKKGAAKRAQKHELRPGTVIEKKFKGEVLRVTVLEDGFRYARKTYPSLTAIALLVTGYKAISGPRFFGITKPASRKAK